MSRRRWYCAPPFRMTAGAIIAIDRGTGLRARVLILGKGRRGADDDGNGRQACNMS
jgi:hypothetical protein